MLRASREAADTNFIVFGFTQPRLEPTFHRTRGEHANYYSTDAVKVALMIWIKTVVAMVIIIKINMISRIVTLYYCI